MHINDLLKIASERKASDLHLKVGSHPVLRINGELLPLVETKRLMQEDTIAMAFSIMSNRQKVGRGARGPVTAALQKAFFDVIGCSVGDEHGWLTFVPALAGAASGGAR